MSRRLRIAQIVVQPVLVWDDGDDLAPGPSIAPQAIAPADVAAFLAAMPAELERLAQADAAPPDETEQ